MSQEKTNVRMGNGVNRAKMYQLASYIEKTLDLNLTPGGEK